MSDNDELNKRLMQEYVPETPGGIWNVSQQGETYPAKARAEDSPPTGRKLVQWGTDDDAIFVPSTRTKPSLPPGLYSIEMAPQLGLFFRRLDVKTENLLRFPHSNCDRVVTEIGAFWDRRHLFEAFGVTHKRGIMLWGPPGSGKSCTIALVMADVIARGGVAIKFADPGLFMLGMHALRQIQRDTPVVVLMEDMDSLVRTYSESIILNILDGVELVDRCVFLASTNYPEFLGARIMNRPSRFDKRFYVGPPTPESRLMYFKHLIGDRPVEVDLERWVADTEGMSLAHLKELLVAVVILGDDYDEAIKTLASMKDVVSSEDDREMAGFRPNGRARAGLGRLAMA